MRAGVHGPGPEVRQVHRPDHPALARPVRNIVIPGSRNPDHIRANADLFDFALTDGEMAAIELVNKDKRYYHSTPEMLAGYASMVPPVDEQK